MGDRGEATLADLIASAYSANTPFVIRHPDLENLSLETNGSNGTVATKGCNLHDLIAGAEVPALSGVAATLDIPLLPAAAREEPWTGLSPEVVGWLEDKLAYTIQIEALDQPRRTLKIGPEIFRYRPATEGIIRELIPQPDDRFDVRGLESKRVVQQAGYTDAQLYDLSKVMVYLGGGTSGSSGDAWLSDGSVIRLHAPDPRRLTRGR